MIVLIVEKTVGVTRDNASVPLAISAITVTKSVKLDNGETTVAKNVTAEKTPLVIMLPVSVNVVQATLDLGVRWNVHQVFALIIVKFEVSVFIRLNHCRNMGLRML